MPSYASASSGIACNPWVCMLAEIKIAKTQGLVCEQNMGCANAIDRIVGMRK
jgi:hypothetical protein